MSSKITQTDLEDYDVEHQEVDELLQNGKTDERSRKVPKKAKKSTHRIIINR